MERGTKGSGGWTERSGVRRNGAVRGGERSEQGRCFRCLGWGRWARECREPPRCWFCRRLGHRSPVCPMIHARARPQVAAPLPDKGVRAESVVVSLEWSPELAERAANLDHSILVSWDGMEEGEAEEIVKELKGRWPEIDFSQHWLLGGTSLVIRLTSLAARDRVLSQAFIPVQGGTASLQKWLFTSGSAMPEGELLVVYLSGLPLLWRTEEVVRRVVAPMGLLANFDEVVTRLEPFPLVRARVWRRREVAVPAVIEAELGGWSVKVGVRREVVDKPLSYAEIVRGGAGGVVRHLEPDLPRVTTTAGDLSSGHGSHDASDGFQVVLGKRRRGKPKKKKVRRVVREVDQPTLSGEEGTRGTTNDKRVGGGGVPGESGTERAVRGKVAIGHPSPSVRRSQRGVLHLDGRLGPLNRDGPSTGLLALACLPKEKDPLNQVVEGGQLSKSKGTCGEVLGMGNHVNGPDFPCVSDLGSSEPSIHNSLGPGSWANFIDSMGRLRWQWNPDAGAGDSEARRAILGSPSISSSLNISVKPLDPNILGPQPINRLRSIIVDHLDDVHGSMEGSCSNYERTRLSEDLSLEDGSWSACCDATAGSPSARRPSSSPMEVVSRVCTMPVASPVHLLGLEVVRMESPVRLVVADYASDPLAATCQRAHKLGVRYAAPPDHQKFVRTVRGSFGECGAFNKEDLHLSSGSGQSVSSHGAREEEHTQ
ncbi:hypothetical protein QJS10_CPB21g01080 [Acorus calamus]|uniref:CCHC-type domain-containing protein n=1 Tax=Acorus calamus TaxID=4465 RepID=A0AAV9C5P8_ACOCL|nr:hypothetical protein QJS10_CPB21g01080 [Acorus calamus]